MEQKSSLFRAVVLEFEFGHGVPEEGWKRRPDD